MNRRVAVVALVVVAVAAVYWLLIRDKTVTPTVFSPRPAALLETGEDEVVVSADGALVRWFPVPTDPPLPNLPPAEPPKGGRLKGPMLEQVRVLAAAPGALRPYLERSFYGETGVDVVLTSGIELRFGDDTQADRKWKAAAAVLSDPTVTTLDYVDLHAPSRPAIGGSGHTLPSLP
ncbi:MAG TPA: cell division protein FtsQ/DivIB [Solirubrobacterales bacterium]|nr:cell division protein FtsQ/DivIB [Solirubrobacterales bacterium]